MIRLAIVLILAAVASLVSWSILEAVYSADMFASKETRESLEVTEDQTRELRSSRLKSDMIAFGMFAALLGVLCGAACDRKAAPATALKAGGIGLAIGLAGGALGAWFGHWHDMNIPFGGEPMTYWFVRWIAILLPIGVAAGIASHLASHSKILDGIVAGVIGSGIASVLYCFLAGSVTRIEGHESVFPAHSENRILAFSLAAICISGVLAGQLARESKAFEAAPDDAGEPTTPEGTK